MVRGHLPVVYSTQLGAVAAELNARTIPVIDDLAALNTAPDLIHAHHHLTALAALTHFPRTPAVYACHGWTPWQETPPSFPTILRYVAVSDLVREKLLTQPGIPEDSVSTIYGFVDTDRFLPKRTLPDRPTSALIFANHIKPEQIETLKRACARAGITRVDVAGAGFGRMIEKPEEVLPDYDVVFALGRSAFEAMACGCAVIVANADNMAGLATSANIARLYALNCGARDTGP